MTPLHTRSCSCGPCERARIRRAHFDVIGGGFRDITPSPRARRWAARLARLEDASGYALLLVAVGVALGGDAALWASFGWRFWLVAAILCGLVACAHRRSPWPLLGALLCFVALGLAAHLALGLCAVAAWAWTALMGVPA